MMLPNYLQCRRFDGSAEPDYKSHARAFTIAKLPSLKTLDGAEVSSPSIAARIRSFLARGIFCRYMFQPAPSSLRPPLLHRGFCGVSCSSLAYAASQLLHRVVPVMVNLILSTDLPSGTHRQRAPLPLPYRKATSPVRRRETRRTSLVGGVVSQYVCH